MLTRFILPSRPTRKSLPTRTPTVCGCGGSIGSRRRCFCARVEPFSVRSGPPQGTDMIIVWTPQGQRKVLLSLPSSRVLNPVYSASGHVIFERKDATQGLWAFPFLMSRLERTGEAFRVSDVGNEASLAQDGTLVF